LPTTQITISASLRKRGFQFIARYQRSSPRSSTTCRASCLHICSAYADKRILIAATGIATCALVRFAGVAWPAQRSPYLSSC